MIRRNYRFGLVVAISLGTASLAVMPAYAQHGANDDASNSVSSNISSSGNETGSGPGTGGPNTTHHIEVNDTKPTSTTTGTSNDDSAVNHGSDSAQNRAEKLLAAKRRDQKQHSTAERQKVCANHKSEIDDKFTNLGARAQKHLDTFNGIFSKVQAFQSSKQLTAPTYDSLVTVAAAKQAAATTAVNTLKALSGTTIDCTAADPAANLANVKTAADDAKTALQAYRTAIKDVVKALQSATNKESN